MHVILDTHWCLLKRVQLERVSGCDKHYTLEKILSLVAPERLS